jgi:hypothetical protein
MKKLQIILLSLAFIFPLSAFTHGKVNVIADAGDDQTVIEGSVVTLDGEAILKSKGKSKRKGKGKGKGKEKDRGKTITYSWEQITGTAVVLANQDQEDASFVAPQPNAAQETLQFELTVTVAMGKCKKPRRSSGHKCRAVTATDTVNITVEAAQTSSIINGHVTDVAGNPVVAEIEVLQNGSVQENGASDSIGDFKLELPDETEYVLKFTAPGYAVQSVPVKLPSADQSIFLEVVMLARGDVQTFDSGSAAEITGADGASAFISPDSFVDGDGNSVIGDIQVTVTPVDISRSATLAAFPGEFSGVLEGDTADSPIVSLGAVEFVFTQNGQPLQLGTGHTATVVIPIYYATYQDGSAINIGDSIPLWSLDADTGIWTQEGVGTVIASPNSPTGLAMSATVSHFTWWNCDVSMNAAQAIVTVYGSEAGAAVVKAHTTADIGWRPTTVETVVDLGTATSPLYIPSNGEVCFWAEINYSSGATATTLQECVTAAPSSLVYIDLVEPVVGPVAIVTQPADTAGVLDVGGYINYAVDPVKLRPVTMENTVAYSIVSGALPSGMSLTTIDATRAQIAGIPTEAGSFSVVIQGEDEDGNTDTVTINYTISSDIPPPSLPGYVQASYDGSSGSGVVDLNTFNSGGAATSWALSVGIEGGPLPAEISLDSATGVLSVSASCIWWYGQVTATNASGSSEAEISVSDQSCDMY